MGLPVRSAVGVLPGGVAVDSIHAQAERILASRRFASSERHCRLLRYLLEQTLSGRAGQLKEYVLGVEVFDREDSFDPQTDPIVRTELSRMRARLKDYYENDGRDDSLIIDLPKRSHALAFQPREAPAEDPAPQSRRSRLSGKRLAAAAALVIVITAFWALARTADRATRQAKLERHPASVAVLPFVNLSPDTESEYFSDGLTEELIHCLAEMDGLRVVSRTSAFQFKGKNQDLRTIAAQLNVEVVLEGTVRRSGDHLRVTTRLVDAADGYGLRSYLYDGETKDVLAVQEQIARQVANALRVDQIGARDAFVRQSAKSAEAYRLYLEGRYHANKRSVFELTKALDRYRHAIDADPDYSPAHASLADACILLALEMEMPPAEAMPQAKQAAQRSVELGDRFSHAHSALASVLALYDWDWAAAEKEFRRALELDPNDSGIREAYAMRCLLPQGRPRSALAELQRAQILDPFSPEIALSLGKAHHFNRDPERAIKTFQQVLQLEPGLAMAPLALGEAYIQKSRVDEALNTLQAASAPTEARLAVLGHAYALSGQPKRARDVLAQLHEASRQRYVSGYYFALVHLGLGEQAEALDWLERAAGERSPFIVYLKVNPLFDGLRGNPRFAALLKKVGLGG